MFVSVVLPIAIFMGLFFRFLPILVLLWLFFVFGWNGIVTVFDIQGLFFVVFLSISIFTDFFDGIINVAGVVLRSVGFFVSVRITITMLLVSAIHRILVTIGIVAIGRLVSVVIVSAVRGLLVTIGIMAICWLVSVVAVSAIN